MSNEVAHRVLLNTKLSHTHGLAPETGVRMVGRTGNSKPGAAVALCGQLQTQMRKAQADPVELHYTLPRF